MVIERYAAAWCDSRHAMFGVPQGNGLIAGAREFGDGAEGAEAPLRIGIGDFPLQQIDRGSRRLGRDRWWHG
jgi:hypothetical protein